jgi:putative membrane protein
MAEMNSMTLAESLGGLNGFLLNFLAGVVLVALFSALYVRITPYAEFRLIREGKVAPAVSFGGALLGFVIPLASAISESISFLDMLVWSVVALVVQVLVFLVLRMCFSGLCRGIAEDELAPAILLGVFSVAAGILSAASMTY